jgi:hypothetical protein
MWRELTKKSQELAAVVGKTDVVGKKLGEMGAVLRRNYTINPTLLQSLSEPKPTIESTFDDLMRSTPEHLRDIVGKLSVNSTITEIDIVTEEIFNTYIILNFEFWKLFNCD